MLCDKIELSWMEEQLLCYVKNTFFFEWKSSFYAVWQNKFLMNGDKIIFHEWQSSYYTVWQNNSDEWKSSFYPIWQNGSLEYKSSFNPMWQSKFFMNRRVVSMSCDKIIFSGMED